MRIAYTSIMPLLLLFGQTQVTLNVPRFLIFELCLWLLLNTSFDRFSNFGLWDALDKQVWLTPRIGTFLIMAFWGRTSSRGIGGLLDHPTAEVADGDLGYPETLWFCSTVAGHVFSFSKSFHLILLILRTSHINTARQRSLMRLRLMCIYLRLHPQSRALLLAMCVKILEILFGGLGEGEYGRIRLESVLMRDLEQVDVHAVALFVANWVHDLALFLGRVGRGPFGGGAGL